MKQLAYQHQQGQTDIFIAEEITADEIFQQCKNLANRFILISDANVAALYAKDMLTTFKQHNKKINLITIPAGEQYKTRATKQDIENKMLKLQCGRDTAIIALGGGVVTDISGFVAATYCRGIPSIYIPTTLLAIVDASIGGKTGVNTEHGKNLIGAFHQPKKIFISKHYLASLPADAVNDGLVESYKDALIADKDLFTLLQQPQNDLMAIICRSIQVKINIVQQDEHELGLRQVLNFGHTVGHALEQYFNYQISHGQAVLFGMLIESYLSFLAGHLKQTDFDKIQQSLNKVHYLQQITLSENDIKKLVSLMALDKKAQSKQPHFVLLNTIGQYFSHQQQFSFSMSKHNLIDTLVQYIPKTLEDNQYN